MMLIIIFKHLKSVFFFLFFFVCLFLFFFFFLFCFFLLFFFFFVVVVVFINGKIRWIFSGVCDNEICVDWILNKKNLSFWCHVIYKSLGFVTVHLCLSVLIYFYTVSSSKGQPYWKSAIFSKNVGKNSKTHLLFKATYFQTKWNSFTYGYWLNCTVHKKVIAK